MTGTKVYETPEDEAGIRYKTVVEYSTNEEGKTVKKVKKYKVYKKKVKVSKAVEARKVRIQKRQLYQKPNIRSFRTGPNLEIVKLVNKGSQYQASG